MTQSVAEPREVVLDLDGMTCASCVARIERKLNKLEGVEATVNFATEHATVRHDPTVSVDDIVAAVEAAGYHARPVAPATDIGGHHHHDRGDHDHLGDQRASSTLDIVPARPNTTAHGTQNAAGMARITRANPRLAQICALSEVGW